MSTAEPLATSEDFIQLGSSSDEDENEYGNEDQSTADEDDDDDNGDDDEEREMLPNGKRALAAASEPNACSTGGGRCYNGQPLPPWLKGRSRLGKGKWPDISDMINEEMGLFVKYISPTPEEHQMRQWVITRMQRVLDNMHLLDVDAQALCFGSFATRLYLPTSDIDMTVMLYSKTSAAKKTVAPAYQGKEAIRRFLYTLAKHMKNAGFCSSCEVIAHARVPIIKTHEMITGIAVDISINADSGVQSAAVQTSFAEKVYPDSLRSIVLAIKQFLSQRSMNEVYTGGIGSYAITLLAVSLFQTHPRILSGGLQLSKNLGILLIEFFELYGKRFNYDNVCISVLENGRYLDKRRKGFFNMAQSYLLAIEDPCDTFNDVSKGTYGILRIKQTFSGAYDLINNAIFAYHQTRKHGEPINDTLRATAAVSSGDQSRRKRIKAMDGNARNTSSKTSGQFNNDPNAHVSFLSSILSVSPSVQRSRERLVKEFYKGSMQKILGVEYQPSLTALLPHADNSNEHSAQEEMVNVDDDDDVSAQDKIATMDFDFAKSATDSGAAAATDAIVISDGE